MKPILTDRQRTLLILKANGYTTSAISHKIGLTASTIDNTMILIYGRLGAKNCPQAVAVALKMEEMTLDDIEATFIRRTS